MAFGAVPAALAIGGTLFGGATSAMQARSQNRAISRAASSQQNAARTQAQQLSNQSSVEKLRRQREAAQIRGRLRVAAGEAGVGLGGTTAALMRQADSDEQLNVNMIDQNTRNQLARINTGLAANVTSLSSQIRSPILDAFAGGVGGFQTGLSLGQAGTSFQQLGNTPNPQ